MGSRVRETTWQDIDAALAALGADRCESRDHWLSVGMALHAYDSGEESFARWDAWSRGSEKYDARALRSSWNGFKPSGGVTVATLFGLAKEDGWTPESVSEGQNGANGAHGGGKDRKTGARAGKEAGEAVGPAKRERRQVWPDLETARARFDELPRAIEHDGALEFLGREYGLVNSDIEGLNWRVGEYPGLGEGIVYPGASPTGQPSYKFKSFARNLKGKREIRFFHTPHDPTGSPAFNVERPGVALVIVSGEEKGALAAGLGCAVLCPLVGEGDQVLHERWAMYVAALDPPEVILANDNDEAGRVANEAACKALAEAGYSARRVRAVKWAKGLPEGYDVNDALKFGQDVREVLQSAGPMGNPITIRNFASVHAMKHDPRWNLLGGYMVTRGGRPTVVAGQPAIGKSRFVEQMAIDVTCGFDFCGLETHGKDTRWLLLQAENTPRRMDWDFSQMLRGSDPDILERVNRNIWFLSPETDGDFFLRFRRSHEDPENDAMRRLRDAVQDFDPDVVVWDPLINFFGGESENSNTDMKACVTDMLRISRHRRPDVAVIIVVHASGGKASTAKAWGFDSVHFHRGATSLIGDAGAAFNLAQAEEGNDERVMLACGKCSDGPRFEPRGLVLDKERMRWELDPDFNLEVWKGAVRDTPRAGSDTRKLKPEMVLEILQEGDRVAQKDLIDRIISTHDIKRTAAQDGLRRMVRDGQICAEKGTNERGKVVWISLHE